MAEINHSPGNKPDAIPEDMPIADYQALGGVNLGHVPPHTAAERTILNRATEKQRRRDSAKSDFQAMLQDMAANSPDGKNYSLEATLRARTPYALRGPVRGSIDEAKLAEQIDQAHDSFIEDALIKGHLPAGYSTLSEMARVMSEGDYNALLAKFKNKIQQGLIEKRFRGNEAIWASSWYKAFKDGDDKSAYKVANFELPEGFDPDADDPTLLARLRGVPYGQIAGALGRNFANKVRSIDVKAMAAGAANNVRHPSEAVKSLKQFGVDQKNQLFLEMKEADRLYYVGLILGAGATVLSGALATPGIRGGAGLALGFASLGVEEVLVRGVRNDLMKELAKGHLTQEGFERKLFDIESRGTVVANGFKKISKGYRRASMVASLGLNADRLFEHGATTVQEAMSSPVQTAGLRTADFRPGNAASGLQKVIAPFHNANAPDRANRIAQGFSKMADGTSQVGQAMGEEVADRAKSTVKGIGVALRGGGKLAQNLGDQVEQFDSHKVGATISDPIPGLQMNGLMGESSLPVKTAASTVLDADVSDVEFNPTKLNWNNLTQGEVSQRMTREAAQGLVGGAVAPIRAAANLLHEVDTRQNDGLVTDLAQNVGQRVDSVRQAYQAGGLGGATVEVAREVSNNVNHTPFGRSPDLIGNHMELGIAGVPGSATLEIAPPNLTELAREVGLDPANISVDEADKLRRVASVTNKALPFINANPQVHGLLEQSVVREMGNVQALLDQAASESGVASVDFSTLPIEQQQLIQGRLAQISTQSFKDGVARAMYEMASDPQTAPIVESLDNQNPVGLVLDMAVNRTKYDPLINGLAPKISDEYYKVLGVHLQDVATKQDFLNLAGATSPLPPLPTGITTAPLEQVLEPIPGTEAAQVFQQAQNRVLNPATLTAADSLDRTFPRGAVDTLVPFDNLPVAERAQVVQNIAQNVLTEAQQIPAVQDVLSRSLDASMKAAGIDISNLTLGQYQVLVDNARVDFESIAGPQLRQALVDTVSTFNTPESHDFYLKLVSKNPQELGQIFTDLAMGNVTSENQDFLPFVQTVEGKIRDLYAAAYYDAGFRNTLADRAKYYLNNLDTYVTQFEDKGYFIEVTPEMVDTAREIGQNTYNQLGPVGKVLVDELAKNPQFKQLLDETMATNVGGHIELVQYSANEVLRAFNLQEIDLSVDNMKRVLYEFNNELTQFGDPRIDKASSDFFSEAYFDYNKIQTLSVAELTQEIQDALNGNTNDVSRFVASVSELYDSIVANPQARRRLGAMLHNQVSWLHYYNENYLRADDFSVPDLPAEPQLPDVPVDNPPLPQISHGGATPITSLKPEVIPNNADVVPHITGGATPIESITELPTLTNDQIHEKVTEYLNQNTPEHHLFNEYDIPHGKTVSDFLVENNYDVNWDGSDSEAFGATIAANYNMLSHFWDQMVASGDPRVSGPYPIKLEELKDIIAQSENGTPEGREAMYKLRDALHWIPDKQMGGKIKILDHDKYQEILDQIGYVKPVAQLPLAA